MNQVGWKAMVAGILAFFMIGTSLHGAVRLPGYFGDHMVLQREKPVMIWGWADAKEGVTVEIAGQRVQASADESGRWRTTLKPMPAGGPYELKASGKNSLVLQDVMIGEVWLCSGQSNMEWSVAKSANAKQEIQAADHPMIRHVKMPRNPQLQAQDDVAAQWTVCSPSTVAGYTACGYYMARELQKELGVAIGLINSSWGGTRIDPWTAPQGFADTPEVAHLAEVIRKRDANPPKKTSHQDPAMLYNGMIHPLLGYTFRGAIWYQGESNRAEGMLYYHKMAALINGWRKLWGNGDFPFYYAQIAPFQYGNEGSNVLPELWEAQSAALAIPHTGMVVTNDVATLRDIHPPDKQSVGKRFADMALNRTYSKSREDSGPIFARMEQLPDALRIHFSHAAGLKTRDGKAPTHFEIAGMGTGFVAADAVIAGETVTLRSDKVAKPLAMRFAWHKLATPNLVNAAGLPTSAFRAGEIPVLDHLPQIKDAADYQLIYDLDLKQLAAKPTYAVDNSARQGQVERVAYLLELEQTGRDPAYLWVSMDPFTQDLGKIAVPTIESQAHFQQAVANLTVESNVADIPVGTGIAGNLEFWPNNYTMANAAKIPGAADDVYDTGDEPVEPTAGYGSMQVHATDKGVTLFAVNHWRVGNTADIGIGNNTAAGKKSRDWTFSKNANQYPHKRLRILVKLK